MQGHLFRLAALALCIAPLGGIAAGERLEYRSAEYTFEVSSAAPGSQRVRVHWSYPVFLGGGRAETNTLNAWVRDQSLLPLTDCVAIPFEQLRKLSDRQVQRAMMGSNLFGDCGVDQSVLEPREAFGGFITFELITEWLGAARPQHGIRTLTFDLNRKRPVGIEALFKSGALDELNSALADKISEERPDCPGRRFDWSQVTLRPPNTVFVHYPYNPAEWAACGDGVELIEGVLVEEQLIERHALEPSRPLVRVR